MKQANLFAGMGSHQSARAQTTTWLTPPEIIAALGSFDLDPCAAVGWDTAHHHFYETDNGLTKPWFGRVWLNPPYTNFEIRQWMAKMSDHDCGTALTFARTETKFFFESVWSQARALLFIEGRLKFHLANGRRSEKNAGAPSVLIAYGDDDCDRLAASDLRGSFVLLQNKLWSIVAVPKTWVQVIREAYRNDRVLSLADLYERVATHPKTESNQHWQAKVRQIVQRHSEFTRLRSGTYELSCVECV